MVGLEIVLIGLAVGVCLSVVLFLAYLRFFTWTLHYAEHTPPARIRQAAHDIDIVLGRAAADMDAVLQPPRPQQQSQWEGYGLGRTRWSEWE